MSTWNPVKKILNLGVSRSESAAVNAQTRLLNMIVLIPFPLYLFATIYSYIFDYYRIVYTNTIPITSILLILFLNYRKKFTAAKVLFLCSNMLTVLIYYKLMDNEKSMFFYYFPLILCFLLFYNPKKERKAMLFAIGFTISIILLTLFLPSAYFEPFPLPESLHNFIMIVNGLGCTSMLGLYVHNIYQVNHRKEMKLIQAREIAEEASKAKADFLSNMSHELRTPLNGIIGSVHIMLMEKHLEEQQQNFNNLKNLSEHMMGLVNDILDFSKIESGKLELNVHQVNLGELTEKIHGYFHNPFHKKNLYYKINIDDQLKSTWVSTDELRLQQILGNLVNNALKFTHKGGVALNVKMLERDETTVKVRFAVKDTGIGIAAEKLQSIFEGFNQADNATTRKYGGTGLGLSISGSLAKLFNSEIKVASKQGSGSEFSFEISFLLQRKAEPVYNNRQNVLSLKDKKVLLAEDNPINMKVAKRMLQGWGLQVEEAGNGKIAVDKCSLQKFDILLIDLSMPEMDGKAAISAINKMPNRAPSLAFTAALYENMRDDLISHGFSDYVMKPFKPEELFDKIQEAIAN